MIIETEREEDGRWIAEITEIHGVMAYGQTREQAVTRVKCLALRDRLKHGEIIPEMEQTFLDSRMSQWTSVKARQLLSVLLRIGWNIKRDRSPNVARIAKKTGLTYQDL